MNNLDVVSIDFETASLVDLKKTGAHVYSEDASTRVLCMAYAFNDEPPLIWRPGRDVFPQRLLDHVSRGGTVRAWNASFELAIWNNTLRKHVLGLPDLFAGQVRDTMAAAAYWGLPLSLDQAGAALNLGLVKNKAGHSLMLRMCKPRAFNPLTGHVEWWHETDEQKYFDLCGYCVQDVLVERVIAENIPPLPDEEQYVWALDNKMNTAGVWVDYQLVERLQDLALHAAGQANAEISRVTGGKVRTINSSAALLAWLKLVGYPHNDLKKDTVAARLDEDDCTGLEREALELRSDNAKTSAAKLTAMLNASKGRAGLGLVRGMLQYYGAFRTGRWAGRLIQLQNMPRGTVKNIEDAVDLVQSGASPEALEALFGPIMVLVSSALRSCIVVPAGSVLIVADFSQIEARVIAWLAGQQDVLDVFASGEDIYKHTVAAVKGIPLKDVTPDLRQLGKVLVLACGFGMSGAKFKTTAETYKVFLSEDEAKANVALWRQANDKIVSFWWECDRAARDVIAQRTSRRQVGPVTFKMRDGHMLVQLPSGRELVYRDALLVPSNDRPGQLDISYMGVNQYTRKWERLRTYGGKLAENITQAIARDVMKEALKFAERTGLNPRLTVHDELICYGPETNADTSLDLLLTAMRRAPAWAKGLPVNAEGWTGFRYKK